MGGIKMIKLKTLNQMLNDTPTLLSFVTVPESVSEDISTSYLVKAIIRRCGDCEPYYQEPTDFQLFGGLWFETHDFLFSHAVDVWKATYNPIENYDRTEEETTTGTRENSRDMTDTHSGTDTVTTDITDTHSGTDTVTTDIADTHSGTDTITDNVTRETEIAGFNSSTYQDSNKETENGTHSTAHGETVRKAGSEATAHGESIRSAGSEATAHGETIRTAGTDSEETGGTRNSHIHGNIGVTTAQQMIEAELELSNKFWIYDYIASAFETDNFIVCYNSYYEGAQFDV